MSRPVQRLRLICVAILTFRLSLYAKPVNAQTSPAPADQPNIIVLFADDMGYGDAGTFGHPTIRTPNIDRMARQGLKFTQFNVAVASCRPSRTSLMTGRYAARIHPTFYYSSGPAEPMQAKELTLAEGLNRAGYATAMTGKWHLTPSPEELGFDREYDVERDSMVVKRNTSKALEFMRENRDSPFFFYLAYYMPHVPLKASSQFRGTSRRGFYGDVIEELDWSVGRILDELKRLGIAEDTYVVFASDNGPWLREGLQGGTAGPFRQGKGTTWEGGVRSPTVAWWPGTIKPGTQSAAFVTTMDLYRTLLDLGGATPPDDLIYDGQVMRDVLIHGSEDDRDRLMVYYYIKKRWNRTGDGDREVEEIGYEIRAARLGPWKAHFITTQSQGAEKVYRRDNPLLFQVEKDPAERHNVADDHPDVVSRIKRLVQEHVQARNEELNRLGRTISY